MCFDCVVEVTRHAAFIGAAALRILAIEHDPPSRSDSSKARLQFERSKVLKTDRTEHQKGDHKSIADLPCAAQRRQSGIVGGLTDKGEPGLKETIWIDNAMDLGLGPHHQGEILLELRAPREVPVWIEQLGRSAQLVDGIGRRDRA